MLIFAPLGLLRYLILKSKLQTGIRLAEMIEEKYSIEFSHFTIWTHSRMCWLRSPRHFKVFVPHIVQEIREMTVSGGTMVEMIINSRSLTYVRTELGTEALTPNHFLLGSSSGMKPLGILTDDPMF